MPPSRVGLEIQDSWAVVTVDCGTRLNYLNPAVLAELAKVLSLIARNRVIETVCIQGRVDGFLLGMELDFFRRSLGAGDLAAILAFTREAHAVLKQLDEIDPNVVAWVEGPTVGAGVELALACGRIVAAPTAKFSFPETGFGIFPGMGGTQRLPRRVGPGLAKWMIYTGAIVPAEHAIEIGLIDAIAPAGATACDPRAAVEQETSRRRQRGTRFEVLDELFGTHSLATLLDPGFPQPADPQAVRALVQLRTKAPLALRLAEQIIDRGLTLPLADGIEEEFAHLAEVFRTADARVGLESAGGNKRPRFAGK